MADFINRNSSCPSSISGQVVSDDRGKVSFLNQIFSLIDVKRIYLVENFSPSVIRAFHGHMLEEKYALVVSGSAIFVTAALEDYSHFVESRREVVRYPRLNKESYIRSFLTSEKLELIHIPPGWANGFRALQPNTKILFFSNTTLEEAKNDDFRFPWDILGKDVWRVQNR